MMPALPATPPCRVRFSLYLRVAMVSAIVLLLSSPDPVQARPSGFDGLFEEAMAQSRQQQRQALRKSLADNPAQNEEQGRTLRRKLSSEERDALRRDLRDANRYGAQPGHRHR